MANGPEIAKQNIAAFKAWVEIQKKNPEGFIQVINRGRLNKAEMAIQSGCGISSMRKNATIKALIEELECYLREEDVLPPLTKPKSAQEDPKAYDQTITRRSLDSKRVSALEQENIELKAKVSELERQLLRFGELSETLSEMGMMPR